MIEASGAIEFLDDGRQLHAEAPFIGTSACRLECLLPLLPPRRDEPGERLDDEHAPTGAGMRDA